MDKKTHGIVSLLTTDNRTTLFTDVGDMIVLETNGEYDVAAISTFLTPLLTGTSSVLINLAEFVKPLVAGLDLGDGIAMTQTIGGKQIEGIFYPAVKTVVTVEAKDAEGIYSIEVPHMENLEKHINRARDENSPSVRNFLRRIAPVLKDRKHSGEDLMMFIEKSELPLTEDGRIIGYKKVKKGEKEGVYVDCHTRNIKQGVGSRVEMDISMVDPDRNRSCSHGLHVCNIGYLRNFYGSDVLIVLVDPSNFIAVPKGETNKARVRSYDVIGVVPENEVQGEKLEDIVSQAVVGHSVKPTTLVTVKSGGIVIYSTMDGKTIIKDEIVPTSVKRKPSKASGKPLASVAKAAKTENMFKTVKALKVTSLADQARKMFDNRDFAMLRTFKKGKKKSFFMLGFTQVETDKILNA